MNLNESQRLQVLDTLESTMEASDKYYLRRDHENFLKDLVHFYEYQHNVYHLERWAYRAILLLSRRIQTLEDFHKVLWDGCLAAEALAEWLVDLCCEGCAWCEQPFPNGTLRYPTDDYPSKSCEGCMPKAVAEAERSRRLLECPTCHDGYYDPLHRRLPEPPRCRVPWFCDQKPDDSGLCQYHRCSQTGCTNHRHLAFGVCLEHSPVEYRVQLAAEEKRRELLAQTP